VHRFTGYGSNVPAILTAARIVEEQGNAEAATVGAGRTSVASSRSLSKSGAKVIPLIKAKAW
jgi:hypothetical protein